MPQLPSQPHFNSRPSARGDDYIPPLVLRRDVFQFTPLREGRLVCASCISTPIYFNSRPSARGDFLGVGHNLPVIISIHAPPRGATSRCRRGKANGKFQFTPLREGRPCENREKEWREIFQFTPLREGRRMRLRRGWGDDNISIHAPPRGATCDYAIYGRRVNFNSRPSARGDTKARHPSAQRKRFQFTPLREGRQEWKGSSVNDG